MATIVPLLKQVSKIKALYQSATRFNASVKAAKNLGEFVQNFIHENLRLAGVITELNQYLAERGWYLAGQLPVSAYDRLAKAAEENRHDEIETFMKQFARTRFDSVIQQIETLWPNRLPIIRDAIEAHSQHKFTLSVPVFLAQADGICSQIFQSFLFTKWEGDLAKKLEKLSPDQRNIILSDRELFLRPLADAMIDALRSKSSLQVSTSTRDKKRKTESDYGPLNRAGVLHGIDLDYNTESNSLRGLLLIDYLIQIRDILQRYSQA